MLNLAFIGCGAVAKRHLDCVERLGKDRVVAAMDTNPENLKPVAKKWECRSFHQVEDLIASVQCDGAVVCTPPNSHRAIAEALLEKRIPVLCEKPLAHTVEDARAMVDFAAQTDVPAYVAYCHRFNPAVAYMQQAVREGRLGDILYFRCVFAGHLPQFRNTWRMDPKVSGGGDWMDTGSHIVDLFHFVIGPVAQVTAKLYFSRPGFGDDAATVLAISESGVPGQFTSGGLNAKGDGVLEVVGTKEALVYDYMTEGDTLQHWKLGEAPPCSIQLPAGCGVRFMEQYKAFREAIAGKSTRLATFADGLAVSEVMDRCYAQVNSAAGTIS